MMITKATLTPEQAKELRLKARTQFYRSNLDFLKAHNGYRPGCFHLVLGMPGGGKSTLRNSMIFDFAKNNPSKKVLLWLSEERVSDFMTDLSFNEDLHDSVKNVYIFSEQDSPEKFGTEDRGLEFFKELVIRSECDLFIYDNITTSKLYGTSFEAQENFISELKTNIQELDTSTVIFAHTSSEIKQGCGRLIDMNDVRGTKSITNYAEFLYILQAFHVKEQVHTTLRTLKYRGQNCKNKMFYLHYEEDKRIYDFDGAVDFEVFNEIYKKQNKLGFRRSN